MRAGIDPSLERATAELRDFYRAISNATFDRAAPDDLVAELHVMTERAELELRRVLRTREVTAPMEVPGLSEVQAALGADEALVEYRLFLPFDVSGGDIRFAGGAPRLAAVVLRSDRMPALVDLGEIPDGTFEGEAIAREAGRLRAAVPLEDARAGGLALPQVAHDWLIGPLEPHLDGIGTLILAPDGPLHALPLAALADRERRLLVERFDLRIVQTGRDLALPSPTPTGRGAVSIGGVDYGERDGLARAGPAPEGPLRSSDVLSPLGYLDESLAEAENVAALYARHRPEEPKPRVLSGTEATEEALAALAYPPRVLHLATHGFFLGGRVQAYRPLQLSGIALAGANSAIGGTADRAGHNGILHALEVQMLNLRGTELVALSACSTALGALDMTEGLEGLPRALFVAGARNVLVALWPVGDRDARVFMERFYEIWLSDPDKSPSEALVETQREFLASRDPHRSAPRFWAPYVVVSR